MERAIVRRIAFARRQLVCCAVVGVAAVVIGCGGSDDDSSTSAAAPPAETTVSTATAPAQTAPAETTSAANPATAPDETRSSPETIALGKEVFASNCQSCHGMAGKRATGTPGELGPDFDEVKFTSRAYVDWRLAFGGFGMQSFEKSLSPDELRAVQAYVFERSGSKIGHARLSAAALASGRAVFDKSCSGCHGIAGRPMAGRPTFPGTDFGEVKPAQRLVREKVVDGYYGWMPRVGRNLSQEQIDAVARYVESLGGGYAANVADGTFP